MRIFLVILFSLVAAAAFADARIELGNDVSVYHAPWSQDDADLEYKGSDGGTSIGTLQHADGTYTASYSGSLLDVSGNMIDADLDFGKGNGPKARTQTTETNCRQTAGTVQDDDGNQYTTNDCTVLITYERHKRAADRYDIYFDMELRRAAAQDAAGVVQYKSVSKAFR